MTTIHIANTIEDMKARLDGHGRLLFATEWDRAAHIYAYTVPSEGRGKRPSSTSTSISVKAFADLGIIGLSRPQTVSALRRVWEEHGTQGIKPGDDVTLPTIDWPGALVEQNEVVRVRNLKAELSNRERVRKVIAEDPEALDIVLEEAAKNVQTRIKAQGAIDTYHRDASKAEVDAQGIPEPEPVIPIDIVRGIAAYFGRLDGEVKRLNDLLIAHPEAADFVRDVATVGMHSERVTTGARVGDPTLAERYPAILPFAMRQFDPEYQRLFDVIVNEQAPVARQALVEAGIADATVKVVS